MRCSANYSRSALFHACTDDAIDASAEDATFSACMKMRVSELKSELDLRKVDYANMFEKDELARALADARAAGRADPSLIDDFNRGVAERAYAADGGSDSVPELDDATAAAVASDGGLPGGMSPETLQELMSNPELMAMLQNPKMQEVMKKVMQGETATDLMDDPELKQMLAKVSSMTGGK